MLVSIWKHETPLKPLQYSCQVFCEVVLFIIFKLHWKIRRTAQHPQQVHSESCPTNNSMMNLKNNTHDTNTKTRLLLQSWCSVSLSAPPTTHQCSSLCPSSSLINPRASTVCCATLSCCSLWQRETVAHHCCVRRRHHEKPTPAVLDEKENAGVFQRLDLNDREFHRLQWSLAWPQTTVKMTSRNWRLPVNELWLVHNPFANLKTRPSPYPPCQET